MWGPGCYQASEDYLAWLYAAERSPAPRGDDFLLARAGGAIVGCIHKMRLLWTDGRESAEVASLHNWVVDERYRTGVGLVLLTKAMRSEKHAFISSALGDLATVYRKLKCQELHPAWYRDVLRPVRGAAHLAIHKASGRAPRSGLQHRFERAAKRASALGLRMTLQPTEREIEETVRSLAAAAGNAWRPAWTVDSFRWRFFHARGPRHVYMREASGDLALFTISIQRGLVVARLIEACFTGGDGTSRFIRSCRSSLKRMGVDVLLGYSAHPPMRAVLQRMGWSPRLDGQPSFLHHARSQGPFSPVAFNGSAADFGFETIGAR